MKVLISQRKPVNLTAYQALMDKCGVELEFRPFFLIEPLSSREFRSERVNILDHSAIVFSSRHAIDAFFSLCESLRVQIPETMKYFCTTEAVAMYLQKHIVYRKRKIFFGDGTPASVIAQIGAKHAGERFLITTSDSLAATPITSLFDAKGLDYDTAVMVKSVSQDIRDLNLEDYAAVVLYNVADVKSLYENFPDFRQGNVKFISFGKAIVKALEDAGLTVSLQAPSPEAPNAAKAIELFLGRQQKL